MKQWEIILNTMLENKNKTIWTAKDFQDTNSDYFIGYEASARMSELAKWFPDLIKKGKDGRFRTLSINWDNIQNLLGKKGKCYCGRIGEWMYDPYDLEIYGEENVVCLCEYCEQEKREDI